MIRLFSIIFTCMALTMGFSSKALSEEDTCTPLLLGSLGDWKHQISTQSKEAQEFFDRGLALTFGFNHDEARRAFEKAAQLDSECAMCYWGMAYVLGPNINAAMEDSAVPKAYAAIQKALRLANDASEKEQAYIEAIAKRYSSKAVHDRSALDRVYADAMRKVHKRFPEDLDAAIFFAESLMNLSPWNYWTADGTPKNHIKEVLDTLEKALKKDPNHPHGNHLYIHAVEASKTPERAVAAADKLGSLVPGSGHLVHMPAHTYIRVGLYHKASLANERAIEVDDKYKENCTSEGAYPLAYMPHNHHFLWASYTLEGRGKDSIRAARELVKRLDTEAMRTPELGTLQHFWITPMVTLARFERWDDALKEPAPPKDLGYPIGMWHYLRGMAFAAKGNLPEAKQELKELKPLTQDPKVKKIKIWGTNPVTNLLKISEHILTGKIAEKQGKTDRALAEYRKGKEIEDALYYDEPHSWYYPVRQVLGEFHLKMGNFDAAEIYFREDLDRHRENGWSLYGLKRALEGSEKNKEAQIVGQRLKQAWAYADFNLKG